MTRPISSWFRRAAQKVESWNYSVTHGPERLFFEDQLVRVTSHRFHLDEATTLLLNCASAGMRILVERAKIGPGSITLALVASIFAAVCSLYLLRTQPAALFALIARQTEPGVLAAGIGGTVLLISVVFMLLRLTSSRTYYEVYLDSPTGPCPVLYVADESYATQILQAVRAAIQHKEMEASRITAERAEMERVAVERRGQAEARRAVAASRSAAGAAARREWIRREAEARQARRKQEESDRARREQEQRETAAASPGNQAGSAGERRADHAAGPDAEQFRRAAAEAQRRAASAEHELREERRRRQEAEAAAERAKAQGSAGPGARDIAADFLGNPTKDKAYAVLGLRPGAPEADVHNAYKKLSLVFHPDRVSGLGDALRLEAEDRMKAINRARDILVGKR